MVLGVDTSLTGTGFALIQWGRDGWLVNTWTEGRKGKRGESLRMRDQRQDLILSALPTEALASLTAAGIESPAFGAPGGSTWDRAGLWWRMVHKLLAHNVDVTQVTSAQRQKFAVGHAHSAKNPVDKADVAMAVAKMWPHAEIRGNDAADALVVASITAVLNDLSVPFDLPKYRTDVIAGLRPPEKEAA